jgi:DNA polymerase III delta subunit
VWGGDSENKSSGARNAYLPEVPEMMYVFYGDDRVRATKEVEKVLGKEYEIFDGEELEEADLVDLFLGRSLLAEKRKILIRDLSLKKEMWEKLPEFIEGTENEIVLLEPSFNKSLKTSKAIVKAGAKVQEFKLKPKTDPRAVFEIFRIAQRDGARAVEELRKIEDTQEPFMFFGLIATQAVKELGYRAGKHEKAVVKELGKIDMIMKGSEMEPWMLIESFLLRMRSL